MLVLIDNDVLFKGSCYGLLTNLLASVCPADHLAGVLASARFVIPTKIANGKLRGDRSLALRRLREFLDRAESLEPTEEEQIMAADIELAALKMGVSLDTGESQLCTILVKRLLPRLLTGDKRAIVAIEKLLDVETRLRPICGKVICLEQMFAAAFTTENVSALRGAVCREPDIDITLTICFSCHSESVPNESQAEGLRSYVEDLRRQATRVLAQ
jgi:hypothetical protein